MKGTPKKLRNGEWGAKVEGGVPEEGDTITITTRAGKSWTAAVRRVLWRGNGVSICALNSTKSSSTPRRASNGECQCGACEDLLSFGYQPGQRIRCSECGGWAEAC